MKRCVFLGLGHYVPERLVTNQELTTLMDTTDEWIVERTGIRQRYWVPGEMGGSELAEHAAREALTRAGLEPGDLDCIILATLSPEHTFPGTACFLQARLGIPGIPALDVRNQCSGFIYGLSVADAWIRSGQYRRILLVGAEVHSTGLDISTRGRDVACLFGDAAAVAVLGASESGERGVLSTHLHADGRFAKALWIEAPGSRFHPLRISHQMLDEGRHFPKMNGRQVFTAAVQRMPEVIHECLRTNGLSIQDVALLVPHQANQRITEMVARQLGIPMERVASNIERYGNTTAASIPLCLYEAEREGRLRPGDLVVLASFGAGFTWASAAVRW
ncbi:MAG: ketoacyl-ACP synthase III [Myxococcales bacterium]|nr:ketoacyl-ACP synthase III [Myxococcales bacterium]